MPTTALPSDDKMLKLKKELNFLLWTNDPPPIPADLPSQFASIDAPQCDGINMQCAAHSLITGALFYRQGFRVIGRGGKAYIFDIEPSPSITAGHINEISRHWWVTANDQLVDLSLYADSEYPLIYRNRSLGDRWSVKFKDITSDWQTPLVSYQNSRIRAVFYVSAVKRAFSDAYLSHDAAQVFPAARAQGVVLTYAAIIEHCERLLSNSTASLTSMTQTDAWRALACPSGNVGTAVGVP